MRILSILLLILLTHCKTLQNSNNYDYLLLVSHDETLSGYINMQGDTVIALGKYTMCYTDTFRKYAIVSDSNGMVGIDRNGNTLYQVHIFDNGPDYPSEGLFRIWIDGKMGYADIATGKVVVPAIYGCGFPFKKGKAEVGMNCTGTTIDEYHSWISEEWFYINKKGERVKKN